MHFLLYWDAPYHEKTVMLSIQELVLLFFATLFVTLFQINYLHVLHIKNSHDFHFITGYTMLS